MSPASDSGRKRKLEIKNSRANFDARAQIWNEPDSSCVDGPYASADCGRFWNRSSADFYDLIRVGSITNNSRFVFVCIVLCLKTNKNVFC